MTTSSTTIVISAGRNVLDEPMSAKTWSNLSTSINLILKESNAIIFTANALGIGEYKGEKEQSVTYVAEVHTSEIERIKECLAGIARIYGQESIALMQVASTAFCG
jgi:hypothetical protein